MNRKVGGQRIEEIRLKYPGYYQKRGNWEERKMQLEKKQKEKDLMDNVKKYNFALNNMDENINRLFELI
tara:strand:+ start:149 stop:355 length:207 start_codon:yes stop_codon:yes gene_type:complete